MMDDILLIRLEGPLQAWGDAAFDTRRPTRVFPSKSALAGLFASALGYTYRDAVLTARLQASLHYAVRADRVGTVVTDFQTAELATVQSGWTSWGIEHRGIGNVIRTVQVRGRLPIQSATQILLKGYLADASFLAAVSLDVKAPVTLDALASALQRPARPLFLGRRACLPSRPLLEGRVTADSLYRALSIGLEVSVPCWYEPSDGPEVSEGCFDCWDLRDYATDRFEGRRRLVRGMVGPSGGVA